MWLGYLNSLLWNGLTMQNVYLATVAKVNREIKPEVALLLSERIWHDEVKMINFICSCEV